MITEIKKLNPLVLSQPKQLVCAVEEEYHGRIKRIADEIVQNTDIMIVLVAGPSSSGKTTSSFLLRKYLQEAGVKTDTISLDDYYKASEKMPRDEFGELDFESVHSLEVEEIVEDMQALSRVESIDVPIFDFKIASRLEKRRHISVDQNTVVIVEGLHALHPEIISHLPKDKMLKIYVSVVAGYTDDEGNTILESRRLRLLRRMSRDSIYRNTSLEKSLDMWSSVVRGEDKYLCPHRGGADIEICSFHDYEVCLFKGIMYDKLKALPKTVENYDSVEAILRVMDEAEVLSPEVLPEDSLMMEFI